MSAILINNSTGNILLTSPKIIRAGSVISSGLAPTREIPNANGGFAIQTQAFNIAVSLLVVGLEVGEDSIRFWDFF